MERIFGEILGMFLVSGTVGIYALVTLVLLIVGYFKHLKPYLADFEIIKQRLSVLPEKHADFNKRIDILEKLIKESHKEDLSTMERKFREAGTLNSKDHRDIGIEFGKIKYIIEEVARKEEKFFDKNNDAFSTILLELAKLETRLDYQNLTNLGGIRKWEIADHTFTLDHS